jgi:threonine/homoserine/homoserine lactone efflux protein
MPTLHSLLLFLSASLALNLTPGPDMALTLARGMTQGFKVACSSVLGQLAAGTVQVPVVVVGLASIFHESPLLFSCVKTVGALYLAYLGIRALLRMINGDSSIKQSASETTKAVFWQGFYTNLLNPKVFIFMIAFLPQFTDPQVGPVWLQLLIFGACAKTSGFLIGVSFAYGAARIRIWFSRNPWFLRVQDGALGSAMILIAGYLFFSRGPVDGR